MNCAILNNQRWQCLYGELEQISSFKDAEFRDIVIRNGLYFDKHKQRSLSQVQICDNPVPRFVHGKWIRGNIPVDKSRDYGLPMKPFFSETPNFWTWADKFWGIWGIFDRFISTHFGTVSPLSMFSINQPLFLQKTKYLCPNPK